MQSVPHWGRYVLTNSLCLQTGMKMMKKKKGKIRMKEKIKKIMKKRHPKPAPDSYELLPLLLSPPNPPSNSSARVPVQQQKGRRQMQYPHDTIRTWRPRNIRRHWSNKLVRDCVYSKQGARKLHIHHILFRNYLYFTMYLCCISLMKYCASYPHKIYIISNILSFKVHLYPMFSAYILQAVT